ncbi:MAG TPA: hypothetical protein VEX37_13680 [Thermomicrobiales bacterium]|nr:hypothetical protein [Thermomicrobiales bacterium]
MHVRLGASVLDRHVVNVGHVEQLVIDPARRQIVQLIAKRGHIDAKHHIIDKSIVDHVDAEGNVHLNVSEQEVAGTREFYAVNYTPQSAKGEFSWTQAVGAPLGGPDRTVFDGSTQYTSLPDNVVLVAKGMDVQDRDFEKIGELEDVEFDQNAIITGFTVRAGRRLRHTHHYFLVEQVAGVGSNYVRVDLSADEARDTPPRSSSD